MQCYPTSAVPVVTTLAAEFAVFDHWSCAVPSETWCNRAFWNAGTSWGFVINPPESDAEREFWWSVDSTGLTIFNQIEAAGVPGLTWKIYTPNAVSATAIIHLGALLPLHDHIFSFQDFLTDCKSGNLPAYSFVEPYFFTPQNDMHPSTPGAWGDGSGPGDVGPILLGELLVWNVYNAIRNSPQRDRTLLIITFDEHGGCYDHVSPPGQVTPPDLTGKTLEDDFDFTRLGVRIPTIMVSSHIAKNTVVNTPMHHGSFMSTVGKKWSKLAPGMFPPLTACVADAPGFSEVFTSAVARQDWPDVPKPVIPDEFWTKDFSQAPLTNLQRSLIDGTAMLPRVKAANRRGLVSLDTRTIMTSAQALNYLGSIPGLRPAEPPSMFK
jgi:phospholipase C